MHRNVFSLSSVSEEDINLYSREKCNQRRSQLNIFVKFGMMRTKAFFFFPWSVILTALDVTLMTLLALLVVAMATEKGRTDLMRLMFYELRTIPILLLYKHFFGNLCTT